MSSLPPNAYEQHLRMECGKAPAHSSAPVVSNQMEPTNRNMLATYKLQNQKIILKIIANPEDFLLLFTSRKNNVA
jgi:hypothetical protein